MDPVSKSKPAATDAEDMSSGTMGYQQLSLLQFLDFFIVLLFELICEIKTSGISGIAQSRLTDKNSLSLSSI